MERLGLGPAQCGARNPRLVYGRMTGWGQSGPLAQAAGHDLNYVALTGLLSLSAHRGERPILPPTVVGDAGGALGMVFGIACALVDARASGAGRVVDAAIVDVVAMLGTHRALGARQRQLDSPEAQPLPRLAVLRRVTPAPTAASSPSARWSRKFYALLLEKLGMTDVDPTAQYDKSTWPALKARFAACLRSQPRAQWCALLEGSDVCFAPVLSIAEATAHPHNVARGFFEQTSTGAIFPKVAPRFSGV